METVGIYLKKEREAKAISLREVSRLTKISRCYLDCIEKDQFEKLPQGPYIKGYISSYSEQIGSDVDEALQLYDAVHKKKDESSDGLNGESWKPQNDDAVPCKTMQVGWKQAVQTRAAGWKQTIHSRATGWKQAIQSRNTGRVQGIQSAAADGIQNLQSKTNKWIEAAKKSAVKGKMPTRRHGIYFGVSLLASAILVLAGFGFYHLFLFEKEPTLVAASKESANLKPSPANIAPKIQKGKTQTTPKATLPQQKPSAAVNKGSVLIASVFANPFNKPAMLKEETTEPTVVAEEVLPPVPETQPLLVTDPSQPDSQQTVPELKLLKASVCAKIQDRMPSGVGNAFPSTIQRVYVWSQIQADQPPSEVRHIYYFDGKMISNVRLPVKSQFWRTWSYKSISDDRNHRGQWRVDIASADGEVLRQLFFTIQ